MGGVGSSQEPEVAPAAAPDPLRDARVRAELRRCAALTLQRDGACIDPASAGPHAPCTAYIQGPLATAWEGAVFELEVSFPEKYPWCPPRLRFTHGLFHPNVAADGSICSRLAGDLWSPALGLSAVLTHTRALLDTPNFSSGDRGDPASEEACLASEAEARRLGWLGATPARLYHYTSRASAALISSSGQLQASRSGLAGPGIYATSMHPTNCTAAQIERNNWGQLGSGERTEFVVELDASMLAEEGWSMEKVAEGRDVWLVRRIAGSSSPSLRLTQSNSSMLEFERASTCLWNREAGQLLVEDPPAYFRQVAKTVELFGQHLPDAPRQRHA